LDARTSHALSPPFLIGDFITPAFSPDGRLIINVSTNCIPQISDALTGQQMIQLDGFDSEVRRSAHVVSTDIPFDLSSRQSRFQFTHDGKRVLCVDFQGAVGQWDAKTGEKLWVVTNTLDAGDAGIYSVAESSADRNLIAIISRVQMEGTRHIFGNHNIDWHVRFLDATTGRDVANLDGNDGRAQFSGVYTNFQDGFDKPRNLIITLNGWPVRVCELYPAEGRCPDWVLKLSEAASGMVVNDLGLLEETKLDRVQTVNEIRAKLNKDPSEDDWTVWGRWLLADPATRCLSPFYARNRREGLASHQPTNKPAP
jgi:WD40 repeat protein